MSNILLLIAVALPIVFSLVIRLLKVNGKLKEYLNLGLVVLTSLLVIAIVIINPSDGFYVFKFTDVLNVELKLDGIGRIFALMVAILWPFAYLYTTGYMKHSDEKKNYSMFYVMTFGVVLGISFAANLVSLYFFYELLTLVTLPLIMHDNTKEAKRAGRFYLYISLFGSTLALFGIIMLISNFGINEFVSFKELANNTSIFGDKVNIAHGAYLLMFFGFGVKAAIFPLHSWLPQAGVAPTPTTALLHAVAVVKAGAFAIIRTIYSIIGVEVLSGTPVHIISVIVVSFTILFGSATAVKQVHLKRRYACSTISNISYILLAAVMMNEIGLYAAMLHLVIHSFAKISIFFTAGELIHNADVNYVDQIDGLAKKMPISFAMFILAGLSIIGIPMFGGFVSKMQISMAIFENGTWYAYIGLACLLISALLTAIYTLSIVLRAYFNKPTEYNMENYKKAHDGNFRFIIPIATFAILSLALGVLATPLINLITSFLGGAF